MEVPLSWIEVVFRCAAMIGEAIGDRLDPGHPGSHRVPAQARDSSE
jgi:hypothetical protein